MKLCIITSIFPPEIGGPAIYSYELAKRLREKHKVRVITWNNSPEQIEGVEIYFLDPGIFTRMRHNILYRALRLLNMYKNLFLYLYHNRKNIDIIYLQNVDNFGGIAIIFAKVLQKPIVVKFVGDAAWETAFNTGKTKKLLGEFLASPKGSRAIKRMIKVQRFVLRQARKVVTPSEFLKEILVKYYKIKLSKIKVIPNAIELRDFVELRKERKSGNLTICATGRLVAHKGNHEIIEVMPELLRKHPGVYLLIIGDGPERQCLENFAQKLDLIENVQFLGKKGHRETINILKDCDLFILNSKYEGLPHIVIEAMACRTPVIATNIRGTDEVVTDGETGLMVSPDNSEELKGKIIRLLEDKVLREKLVENAYKRVEEKFTWEKNLSMLEKELEEVV